MPTRNRWDRGHVLQSERMLTYISGKSYQSQLLRSWSAHASRAAHQSPPHPLSFFKPASWFKKSKQAGRQGVGGAYKVWGTGRGYLDTPSQGPNL
jgi:hypothetical protein